MSRQTAQETVAPDVDAAVRLFSDKRLAYRKGAMVWLWTAFTPLMGLGAAASLLNGAWDYTFLFGFLLATAFTLNRLASNLDCAQVALQTNLDKRWLGALVDALEWPNRRIQAIARWVLIRLLPTVTEEDAALLDEAQRANLYARLHPRKAVKDTPLTFAILKALEHIGRDEAVTPVTYLAKMSAFTFKQDAVRQAARASLPALEQRVLRQRLAPVASEAQAPLPVENEMPVSSEQQQSDVLITEQLKSLQAELHRTQPGMRLGFLMASWGIIFPYTTFRALESLLNDNWLQALLFGVLALGTTQMHRLTLTSKHRAMADFLAEQDSVQAVGALAEALDWPDPYIRHVVIKALSKLLPRLHASDSTLLNPRQRAALYRMLTMENATTHSKFLVLLLKALEQVGDAAAIPYVEQLARITPMTSPQQKVHDAALDCLPFLREQAKQNNYSQTLLRAASADHLTTETLLRPASGPRDVEPATLLRADTSERSGH